MKCFQNNTCKFLGTTWKYLLGLCLGITTFSGYLFAQNTTDGVEQLAATWDVIYTINPEHAQNGGVFTWVSNLPPANCGKFEIVTTPDGSGDSALTKRVGFFTGGEQLIRLRNPLCEETEEGSNPCEDGSVSDGVIKFAIQRVNCIFNEGNDNEDTSNFFVTLWHEVENLPPPTVPYTVEVVVSSP